MKSKRRSPPRPGRPVCLTSRRSLASFLSRLFPDVSFSLTFGDQPYRGVAKGGERLASGRISRISGKCAGPRFFASDFNALPKGSSACAVRWFTANGAVGSRRLEVGNAYGESPDSLFHAQQWAPRGGACGGGGLARRRPGHPHTVRGIPSNKPTPAWPN